LEHAVGVRLLDRSPHGVEPTIYGRALINRSLAAFDELRQGVNDIEFLADPTMGDVRIGSTFPLTASFVSAVVDQLSQRYPRIVFHLLAADTGVLHRALSERRVDFLIARMFAPLSEERMRREILYDDPYVVVAGSQNPWVRRRKIELAELMKERWVLPPLGTLLGSVVAEAFGRSGLDVPRATVVAFPDAVQNSLLATGRYLTILPESALRFPATHPVLKKLPVTLAVRRRPIGIVTLANRTLSPVAQLFIDCAREIAKPLVKGK